MCLRITKSIKAKLWNKTLRKYLHFQDLLIEMLRLNYTIGCPRNQYSKNQCHIKNCCQKSYKSKLFEWTYGHSIIELLRWYRNYDAKIEINRKILTYIYKSMKKNTVTCFHWMNRILVNNYRNATLSKSYLTIKGITKQSLKSIGQL